jgi:hypothetical protein
VSGPAGNLRYETRDDALSKPFVVELDGERLRVTWEGLPPLERPLAEVACVRLAFDPTRAETNRFELALELRSGERFRWFNRRYRGVLDFEDSSTEYAELARRLCAEVRRAAPTCRFVGGAGPLRFLVNVLCVAFFSVVFVAALVWFLFVGFLWGIALKLLLALFLGPAVYRWLRRNRPREFDPLAIPAELLPR